MSGPTLTERFWAKVAKSHGCWEWVGSRTVEGYGRFYDAMTHSTFRAHRYVYERLMGCPIDPRLTLDHLCRNPGCVNPAHLEPVTVAENILRGTCPAAKNLRKTHCPRGHALTGKNLYIEPCGKRYCRACRTERNRIRHTTRILNRRQLQVPLAAAFKELER